MKKIKLLVRTILSVFTAAILLGAIPACSSRQPTKTGPKYVAHRGYSHSYLANTEEAFRAAARMTFYGIETDIRKTKDGYFVCNHDATVKYADKSELTISSAKLDALLEKPLENDKTDEDAYLCTFEKYLRACKEGKKVAVIELKESFAIKDLRSILAIIDREYDRKKVTFISFSYYPLGLLRQEAPSIPLQYLSQEENDPKFKACLNNGISIDVKQTILTEELVTTFHDAGLTVNVWTVNDEEDLQTALQLGVDYITTDLFHEE